ncbi:putative RDD protein [Vibrio cholerae]|nr:putative RDD protein [Vibrio cholerae]
MLKLFIIGVVNSMNENVPAKMSDLYEYSGFWPRVGASLIDTIIICVLTYPILISVYGWSYFESDELIQGFADLVLSWLFPMVAIIALWTYHQTTPGKMAISAKIVDAKTGNKPTFQQCIVRYVRYFLAIIPLGLGIFWVAWDKRKQGWHDKLAGTVVICNKDRKVPQPVEFSSKN